MFANRARIYAVATAVLVLMLLPLKRIEVEAPFVLEPQKSAVLRAQVPGTVDSVLVREGEQVAAGQVLAKMSNLQIASNLAESNAALTSSRAKLRKAQMEYGNVGAELNAAAAAEQVSKELTEQNDQLTITSPISGVVVSARPQDLNRRFVDNGTELLEVADTAAMRARIFVPEAEMRRLPTIRAIRVRSSSQLLPEDAVLESSATAPEVPQPGLVPSSALEGTRPAAFYVVLARVNERESLMPGMSGTAKLFGPRHSLAYYGWETLRDFAGRKIW